MTDQNPKKNGRPSLYTEEVADRICDRLASGESLREICGDRDMPSRSAVLAWIKNDDSFRAKCARAREAQAESVIEDMVDIESDLKKGVLAADVARVLLSSKQWRACKQAPKKYGDKLIHSGDKENPVEVFFTDIQGTGLKVKK